MASTALTPASAQKPRSAWRTWLGRLAALLIGLAFGLLLVEVLLRVAARQELLPAFMDAPLTHVHTVPWSDDNVMPPPLLQPDSYYGLVSRLVEHYKGKAGSTTEQILDITTMNWLDPHSYVGFRVPDRSWQPTWPVEAVVVGDSFSFCYTQYADCWVTRLQTEHNLSTVDLGMIGTGSVSHLRVLDTFGLAYKPRIVIWQWYANDYLDDTLLSEMNKPARPNNAPPRCTDPSPAEAWLNLNSGIAAIVNDRVCAFDPDAVDPYHVQSGAVRLYFGSKATQDIIDIRKKRVERGMTTTQNTLIKARQLAADHGAALVIVVIPTKEEAYKTLTEPQMGAATLSVWSAGRLQLDAFCQSSALTCLDATDVLTSHANQGEQIYWPTESHLNPAGNQVLAEAVADFLRAQGLTK